MMFVLILVGAIALFAFWHVGWHMVDRHAANKTYGVKAKEVSSLSTAAKKILAGYHALPEANRPHGNMFDVLVALDTKHGGAEEVTSHHNRTYSGYFAWPENHGCGSAKHCPMREYNDLMYHVNQIDKGLKTQARELEVAGLQSSLSLVDDMIEQMKTEQKIIADVTKQLTE